MLSPLLLIREKRERERERERETIFTYLLSENQKIKRIKELKQINFLS